jgi:hypothetical protein
MDLSVSVTSRDTPGPVRMAVIATDPGAAFTDTVAVNVATRVPPATVTVAGTVTSPLPLPSATGMPLPVAGASSSTSSMH